MGQEQLPAPMPPEQTNAIIRWLGDVIRQGRLAWRLFWDKRVPFLAKLIPPAALAYVLFPFDILPDMALGLGQLDDLAALLIGIKLFIEVAPPDVVREHLIALGARINEWRVADESEEEPEIAEGELADAEDFV